MVAQIDANYRRARPTKVWSRLVSYLLFEGRPLTTRGRWINPLVFALFSVEKRLPIRSRIHKPIFLVGTGRSGTTVLGKVLSIHRDVGFLNEPKAIWHSVYRGEDLIGSYDRGTATYRIPATEARDDVIRAAHRIFSAYTLLSGSKRVLDKYGELIFRAPFVKAIFPDAKFVFLARNGWDTCVSMRKWSEARGRRSDGKVHDWWGADGRKWQLLVDQIVPEHADLETMAAEMRDWTDQTNRAIVEWIVTMREGMHLCASDPANVLRVDYEKVCANPRAELTLLAESLELGPGDTAFLDYAEQTLRPSKPRGTYDIHSALRAPFFETMKQLGYEP